MKLFLSELLHSFRAMIIMTIVLSLYVMIPTGLVILALADPVFIIAVVLYAFLVFLPTIYYLYKRGGDGS